MRMGTYPARITALAALLALSPAVRAEPVSFRNEVMAVLSKAGCNQGTCHGNLNGKNGFKLSLRGDDPDFDLAALTRDVLGRRTNPLKPAESLILLKATASVPHEGGRRFSADSPEYEILARWIAAGLPADSPGTPRLEKIEVTPSSKVMIEPEDQVALKVKARFSDGTLRDVTRFAVFEPANLVVSVTSAGDVRRQEMGETTILVRYLDKRTVVQLAFVPRRADFIWKPPPENNYIDRHVFAKLKALQIQPSDVCSDSVFIRRAYLDAIGILPTADETRAFLSDTNEDKRARLIDRLLDRPEFADYWALKWADLLRVEEKVLDRKGVATFHAWIRQSIAEGKPLNEFARELIAARGSTYTNPPANFYRALRDPQTRAETVSQVFLGVRLQCAKCHNHPFDQWTQNDYHSFSAFFARIDYKIVENNRRDRFDKHEFDGEQIVWLNRSGEIPHPRTGDPMQPRLLGTSTAGPKPELDRLDALADWIARPDNAFFGRTQVNRIWYHLLGRGIVEPIDDFRATNPPVNELLLDALAKDFVAHHFDLRYLVRTIMNSRTYHLSARPNDTNRDDETNFSHALVRRLEAEQLLDAFVQVTGGAVSFNGYPPGTRAGQLPGIQPFRSRERSPTLGEQFLRAFGKPDRLLSCECERAGSPTLNHAFQLVSGPLVNDLLTQPDNRLARLLSNGKPTANVIDALYLAALCRLPTNKERQAAVVHLDKAKDRRAALEDIVWGLLNSKEFLLRQ